MPNDATQVRLGPGVLKVAPIGTAIPVDLTAAWNAAFIDLGYTEDGHSVTANQTFEGVPVAEEIDMLSYELTSRETRVAFALAQMTAANLSTALNGGTITAGTGIVTFEPPDPDEIVRVMIGWESLDGLERWVFKKCLQVGNVEIARRKAPAKATIPVEFMCEIVAGGGKPFVAIFDDTLAE